MKTITLNSSNSSIDINGSQLDPGLVEIVSDDENVSLSYEDQFILFLVPASTIEYVDGTGTHTGNAAAIVDAITTFKNANSGSNTAVAITDATRPIIGVEGVLYLNADGDSGNGAYEEYVGGVWKEASFSPLTVPSTPSSLTSTAGNTQLTINCPNAAGAATYEAQASVDDFATVAATASGAKPIAITGLSNGTPYKSRIRGLSSRLIRGGWRTSSGTTSPTATLPPYDYSVVTGWYEHADSIGDGIGTTGNNQALTWPSLVAVDKSFGFGGTTASGKLLERISANQLDPATIPSRAGSYNRLLIALGVNDGVTAGPKIATVAGYIADYCYDIEAALALGWAASEIAIVSPYYVLDVAFTSNGTTRARYLKYQAAALSVAKQYGCVFMDVYSWMAADSNPARFFTNDAGGVHPNDVFHDEWRDYLENTFQWVPETQASQSLWPRLFFEAAKYSNTSNYPLNNSLGYYVADVTSGYNTNYSKADKHFAADTESYFAVRLATNTSGFIGIHPSSVLGTGGVQSAMNLSSVLITGGSILAVDHNGMGGTANSIGNTTTHEGEYLVFGTDGSGVFSLWFAVDVYDDTTWTKAIDFLESYAGVPAYPYLNLEGNTGKTVIPVYISMI